MDPNLRFLNLNTCQENLKNWNQEEFMLIKTLRVDRLLDNLNIKLNKQSL